MLTIADITAEQFHADFAGLSACKTAVGGVDLPDEAITLAAAMHYTGYRHVVATLWSVKDDASSEVFTTLYDRIAVDGSLRPDLAAAALHDAVRNLRKQFPMWPHTWTPFAHIGP
jgi:CHAT domain-containing protein